MSFILPPQWCLSRFGLVALLSLAVLAPAQAQIIPDTTLPNNSNVPQNCTNCLITGGTTRENVLFHSFREFSVRNNGAAVFRHADNIQTILTRVTGNTPSSIDGILLTTVNVPTISNANLFLLNPNGIIFGPNAQLRVGGSFLATTASSFKFPDGSEFSTTNPQAPPVLLTVNIPTGLQFGANPGAIVTTQTRLATPMPGLPRRTIALVGGDLNLTGGSIQVRAGQIELGSVGESSLVWVTPSDNGVALDYSGISRFRNMQLAGNAQVAVSGVGGGVAIAARNLQIQEGARLVSITAGANTGGNIRVNATDTIELLGTVAAPTTTNPNNINRSGIFTSTNEANGNAGSITVSAQRLNIAGGAQISSATGGSGSTGGIALNVPNAIAITDVSGQTSSISSSILNQAIRNSTGNVGTVRIDTNTLTVQAGAQIQSTTFGAGSAGLMQINATTIDLSGVVLTPEGNMFFDQRNVPIVSGLFASSDQGSTGNAAALNINTQQLRMRDGAIVQTSTLGSGNAGVLSIQADAITLTGTAPNGISPTAILAASGGIPQSGVGLPEATGQGGAISITTNSLVLQNKAEIAVSSLNTSTNGNGAGNLQVQGQTVSLSDQARLNAENAPGSTGPGGNITVSAETLELTTGAEITASTAGFGPAGSIEINVQTIDLRSEANISTNTSSSGDAGNLTVTAQDQVTLNGQGTRLTASTAPGSAGKGGSIAVGTNILELTDNAEISASTTGSGTAGSVQIKANDTILEQGSRITSNTSSNGAAGDLLFDVTDTLQLTGIRTGLFASTDPGSSGNGGNIIIDPRWVRIEDGASIAVDSKGSGIGGNIFLQAGRLELQNQSSITAETASAQGGNITLDVSDTLLLRFNNSISATAGTAQQAGDGGNITIRAPFIISVLSENNDISANAFTGRGGNINITANAILGLRVQSQLTPFSDITASSEFGLSGSIILNILNTDPNRGLVALPVNLVDPSQRIVQNCQPASRYVNSSFVILGKGGLPPNPTQPLSGETIFAQPVTLNSEAPGATAPVPRSHITEPSAAIVEAQGWSVSPNGDVYLMAAETGSSATSWSTPRCPTLQ